MQELQKAREAKQQRTLQNADPTEDVERFEAEFRERVQSINSRLEALTAEDVVAKCQALKTATLDLSEYLSRCTHFLHPYTVTKCEETIAYLQDSISQAQERLQPRKRFAFRGGVTTKKVESVQQVSEPAAPHMAFEGICDQTGQTFTKSAAELEQSNCYQLKNLTDCTIVLPGRLKAVHILNVLRCTIYVGEVSGAAHVTGCCQSSISISCHQLRIHQSSDSSFCVNVKTQPIVEDVRNIQFAPYNFSYPGQIPATGESLWDQVRDFKWLKSEPSPNWSILPEAQRTQFTLTS